MGLLLNYLDGGDETKMGYPQKTVEAYTSTGGDTAQFCTTLIAYRSIEDTQEVNHLGEMRH
jgi:hypothetical protein